MNCHNIDIFVKQVHLQRGTNQLTVGSSSWTVTMVFVIKIAINIIIKIVINIAIKIVINIAIKIAIVTIAVALTNRELALAEQ